MIDIDGKVKIFFDLKHKPRQQQIRGLNFIKKSIKRGKSYMLLNLPTGVGKSYLSVMFINWYLNNINEDAKFDILTNSKILQEQYIKEFPYIRNLKGRSNYWCAKYQTNCEEGLEICSVKKSRCNECPYQNAVDNYISSTVSLTNFHMFNISSIYATQIKERRKSNVLIVDEAHDFESVFCDHLTTEFNKKTFKKCGFEEEKLNKYHNILNKIKDLPTMITYIEDVFIPDLKDRVKYLKGEIEGDEGQRMTQLTTETHGKYSKELVTSNSFLSTLGVLIAEYNNNPDNWVLEIVNREDKRYNSKSKGKKFKTLVVQPVWARDYLYNYIFKNYDHVLFMSASILNKSLFSYINGLQENLTTYYEMESPFPIKNRKIYYIKTGKMTYNQREETFKRQYKIVKKILNKYPDKKGIIHTFNYLIAEWLDMNLAKEGKNGRLIYHQSSNRGEMYDMHISKKEPTVLVSPSMISGIDLKDDLSRFQVMMKIPYPNISSNKIKKRQQTNREWYYWKTVVDIMQSYGRSIRSETDYADTYILDSSFSDIITMHGKLLPKWFTDAIKIVKV